MAVAKKKSKRVKTLKSVKALKPVKQVASAAKSFRMPPSISRAELLDDNGQTDHIFRQMLYDFSAMGARLEDARAYLAAQIGLTSPQYNLVMIVAQYQGAEGVSVSEVAQHMHVSTAFITSEVRKLQQAAWLVKQPNPRDGRGVLLRLGAKAEAGIRTLSPERRRVNDALFSKLRGRDLRQLAATLTKLIEDGS